MNRKELYTFIAEYYFNALDDGVYGITMFLFFMLGILYPRLVEFSDLIPSFLLYICGGTGTRKTTTSMMLLNPFDFETGSFEDSLTSCVELFRQTPLGCFLLDDLKKADSEALQILNKMLRLVGDVTTQGRKMRGGKVLEQNISSLCVVTGEIELHLQESSMARILVLQYDKNTVNLDELKHLQSNKAKLCSALICVIQRLMQDKEIIVTLCDKVIQTRGVLMEKFKDNRIHGRYIDMMSWLMTIYNIIMQYFAEEGLKIEFDYEEKLQNLIFQQHLAYSNESVSVFAKCLFELYQNNGLSVFTESEFSMGNHHPDIIDYNSEWFIASGTVFKKVKSYAESIGLYINFSEKKLRADLLNAEILQQRNQKNTYELRKGNNRCSGFYIRKNLLMKYLENELGGI